MNEKNTSVVPVVGETSRDDWLSRLSLVLPNRLVVY